MATLAEFYDMAFHALPKDVQAEMKGIYETFPGIDRDFLILINLIYEVRLSCTSIVAKTGINPTDSLIHGRNLDFPDLLDPKVTKLGPNHMQDAVFNAKIIRKGEILYQGTYFIGFLFPLDGLKNEAFSYSINQRGDMKSNLQIIKNIFDWAKGRDLHDKSS